MSEATLKQIQQQHHANIVNYCQWVGVDIGDLVLERVSVAYITRDEAERLDTMSEVHFKGGRVALMRSLKAFEMGVGRPHRPNHWMWRCARSRLSMQVHVAKEPDADGKFHVACDIDAHNPWDVVGIVRHLWDVVRHKVERRDTDPWWVARQMQKAGFVKHV